MVANPAGKTPAPSAQQIADLAVEILARYMKRSRDEIG
jgi:hypothetical protein